MECKFFTLSKRINSTLQPTGDGDTLNIVLKDATNLYSPTLDCMTISDPRAYNYCRLFDRYYFVRDWRSLAYNLWECELKEDVYATWKDSVIGQNVYARYTSNHYNTLLDDSRVTPLKTYTAHSSTLPFTLVDVDIHNFITITGKGGNNNGTCIFCDDVANEFFDYVSDMPWWQDLGEKINGIDPLDYIGEAWATPLRPAECFSLTQGSVQLFDMTVSGQCLSSPLVPVTHAQNISIPRPTNTDFRYTNKYVKYYLTVPYCAVKTLPTDIMSGMDAIRVHYSGDCTTGSISVVVLGTGAMAGVVLAKFSTSLKMPIIIGRQANINIPQIVASGLSLATSAYMGNIAGGVGSIKGITQGFIPSDLDAQASAIGSIAEFGSRLGQLNIVLTMVEYESSEIPDASVSGRPTFKNVSISGGYYECSDASVSFAGTSNEISEFNNALNSGLYVE